MLRSLVGSEMCIRDRYQRRVRGQCKPIMAATANPSAPVSSLLPGRTEQLRGEAWYVWCSHRQWCPRERFREGHSTCNLHLEAATKRRKRRKTANEETKPAPSTTTVTATVPSVLVPTDRCATNEWRELQSWLDSFMWEDVDISAVDGPGESAFNQALQLWREEHTPRPFGAITKHLQTAIDVPTKITPAAMYLMGVCAMHGLGVPRNQQVAIKLWQQASSLGFLHAKFVLGCCSMFGLGVPVDMHHAHLLFSDVAARGHPAVTMTYADMTFKLKLNPEYTSNNKFSLSFPCACPGQDITKPCSSSICECTRTGQCHNLFRCCTSPMETPPPPTPID
eukprot:TRINITY_DN28946_c0_g1_i1.p1 TRINITY_DN28946_c0_g1~~TRINITY_DN28946_c0_g1_i1.p1  ORF type:complete len:337 (+),score=70.00 TRINITY_DN28946_c0_g1_i1:115-1125(+)